jgi:hypothetical protein
MKRRSPSLPSDAQIREMLAERVDVQRRNRLLLRSPDGETRATRVEGR